MSLTFVYFLITKVLLSHISGYKKHLGGQMTGQTNEVCLHLYVSFLVPLAKAVYISVTWQPILESYNKDTLQIQAGGDFT